MEVKNIMIRKPSVAGLFYESNKSLLEENIKNIFNKTGQNIPTTPSNTYKTKAAIVPHAGYIYSGKTASYAYGDIARSGICDTVVIIGPNHTGYGDDISLTTSNTWQTPIGDVCVDSEFNNELEKINSNITFSPEAHIREHSIEVELPFLQYISNIQKKSFKIVPIVITRQQKNFCVELAHSIYDVSKKLNRNIMVVASTDLTHYENATSAKNKDEKILKSIEDMDIDSLLNNINKYNIIMCGYGPTITAIIYSKLVNANRSIILDYSNSGEVYNDYESVVGYASAVIKK